MTVHHGAWIELRMVIVGQLNRSERVLVDAVLMHEAARAHGDPLSRDIEAVRSGIGRRARYGSGDGRLTEASELALRQRAEDHAILGIAGCDGSGRVTDGA